jgi:hypothetical protein
LNIYQIGSGSLSLVSQLKAKKAMSASQGLIRYSVSTGLVEYSHLKFSQGAFTFYPLSTETWPKGSKAFTVPMTDGTTQIFTISSLCIQLALHTKRFIGELHDPQLRQSVLHQGAPPRPQGNRYFLARSSAGFSGRSL